MNKRFFAILLAGMILALVFVWIIGERGTGALAQQGGGNKAFVVLKCIDKLDASPRAFVVAASSASVTAPRIAAGASCAQTLSDLTGNAGLQILNVKRSEPVGGTGDPGQSTGLIYTLGPAGAIAGR